MAGGNWQVIDEKLDLRVVKQQDNISCGVACGEMLLKEKEINNINQKTIAERSGIPVDVATLANVLNFSRQNLTENGKEEDLFTAQVIQTL